MRARSTLVFALLLLVCGAMFFFALGERPLWDVDEAMHAETSKDILLHGDWIVPKVNGEPFYDKPIFYNWLGAICMAVFGILTEPLAERFELLVVDRRIDIRVDQGVDAGVKAVHLSPLHLGELLLDAASQ